MTHVTAITSLRKQQIHLAQFSPRCSKHQSFNENNYFVTSLFVPFLSLKHYSCVKPQSNSLYVIILILIIK